METKTNVCQVALMKYFGSKIIGGKLVKMDSRTNLSENRSIKDMFHMFCFVLLMQFEARMMEY